MTRLLAPGGARYAVRGVPIALAILLAALHPVAAPEAASDDPAAVVARLFDAMRAKDTTALRGLFHADARLFTAARDRTGAPVVQVARVDDFLRAVTRTALHLDERIRAPEVRVDEGLATVWVFLSWVCCPTSIETNRGMRVYLWQS